MFLVPVPFLRDTRPPANTTWTDSGALGTAGTNYGGSRTWNMNFGTATADRVLIICGLGADSSVAFSTMTVEGVTATKQFESGTGSIRVAFFTVAMPTGTSGDIFMSFTSGMSAAGMSVYAAYGLVSAVPITTVSSAADPATSGSLTIPSGGFGIGWTSCGAASGADTAWTGFNLDTEFYIYDVNHAVSSAHHTGAATVTASPNWDSTSSSRCAIFGVWR